MRTENLRFWPGPQIGFGFMFGKNEDMGPDSQCNVLYASLGAFAGVNIHTGDFFSIGIDGGYRRSANTGYSEAAFDGSNFTGPGNEVFADISFIYRLNESFTE